MCSPLLHAFVFGRSKYFIVFINPNKQFVVSNGKKTYLYKMNKSFENTTLKEHINVNTNFLSKG